MTVLILVRQRVPWECDILRVVPRSAGLRPTARENKSAPNVISDKLN